MIERTRRVGLLASLCGGFLFVLMINGAVPFVLIPTVGQAIWTMGFAQSLAKGALFSVHAHNFGIPHPAAIAFGLSGAWPASLLIRLGLQPVDAYAGMVALWLGVAFFSSYRLAQKVGAPAYIAVLGSMAWLSVPVVWTDANYSMVSLGMALLPFYFFTAMRLLSDVQHGKTVKTLQIIICFVMATVISVFMDGYTFVMFAVGTGIWLAYCVYAFPGRRSMLLSVSAPVYVLGFVLAYLFYSFYIGRGGYDGHPIDFFRGWGVDLIYLVVPTKGMMWFADALKIGVDRTDELHFGDSSVWRASFCLPILVLGGVAWQRAKRNKMALGMALVAIFGFYMSLGPSLKVNSLKPESLRLSHPHQQSALMPAELAVMPTGNAWISETLPGFKEMRAAYRWTALGVFAVWLLIMAGGGYKTRRGRLTWCLALLLVVMIDLPDSQKVKEYLSNRQMFEQIDQDLVSALGQHVHPGERVAFLPWRNDFMAGYLASRLEFNTFNIGGDKNLAMAQPGWPREMAKMGQTLTVEDVPSIARMLIDHSADVVVLPYFNMLWSAHFWPCLSEVSVYMGDETREVVHNIPDFLCPDQQQKAWVSELNAIRNNPSLIVDETGLFATVRLRPELKSRWKNDAYDKAGVFTRQYLDDDDLSKVVVVGSDADGIHRSLYYLDNTEASFDIIQNGAEYDLTKLPAGKDWALLIGDYNFIGKPFFRVSKDGFSLVRISKGNVVNFKKGAWPGVILKTSGLSAPEPWGTWSQSDTVIFEFASPLPNKFKIYLVAHAFGPNVEGEFEASIGKSVAKFRLSASDEQKIIELENPTDSNVLRIRIPHAVSPKALGLSDDDRNLGVGFVEMKIVASN